MRTWLIPNWTEIDNRQEVILCVKISGKCTIQFFRLGLHRQENEL